MSTPLERLHARAAYATSHNDNSAIFRSPATGNIIAWIDVAGTAHHGPVDERSISPATRAQLRDTDDRVTQVEKDDRQHLSHNESRDHHWQPEMIAAFNTKYDEQERLEKEKAETVRMPAIPSDEQTLDRVDVRPFQMNFRDSTPREVMGPDDDETNWDRPFWFDLIPLFFGCIISAAVVALTCLWILERAIPVSQPVPAPAPRVQSAPVEIDWVTLDHPSNWANWPGMPQEIERIKSATNPTTNPNRR